MTMKKTVLVVDDSATMRDMVSYTLATAGFDVVEAEDGVDALDLLGDGRVDLIVTDINMPRLDGIGLIQRLRGQDGFKGTPILCLTTERGDDTKNAAREAGATGWIQKPFDPDKLVRAVKRICL